MNEAKYVSSSQLSGTLSTGEDSTQTMLLGHSGLGLRHYTHFTSPIRRYADIIVHRELLVVPRSLPVEDLPDLYFPSHITSVPEDGGTRELSSTLPNVSIPSFSSPIDKISTMDDELDLLLEKNGFSDVLTIHSFPAAAKAPEDTVNTPNEANEDDIFDVLIASAPMISHNSLSITENASSIASLNDNGYTETQMSNKQSFGNSSEKQMEPYSSSALESITRHLNSRNRAAKAAQMQSQNFFLSLYFRNRVQKYEAVIYGVKANGLLVYIPDIDFKGPCYLQSKEGKICVDPRVIDEVIDIGDAVPDDWRSGVDGSVVDSFRSLPQDMYTSDVEIAHSGQIQSISIISKAKNSRFTLRTMDSILVEVTSAMLGSENVLPDNPLRIFFVRTLNSNACRTKEATAHKGLDCDKLKKNKVDEVIDQITKNNTNMIDSDSIRSKNIIGVTQSGASTTFSEYKLQDLCSRSYWSMKCLGDIKASLNESIETPSTPRKSSQKVSKFCRRRELPGSKACRLSFSPLNISNSVLRTGGGSETRKMEDIKEIGVDHETVPGDIRSLRGIESARVKMANWGEDWAEEEDLPIFFEENDVEEGDTSYGRIKQLASARIDKLKVEKRKSKY